MAREGGKKRRNVRRKKKNSRKPSDSVVKINSELLNNVEEFINKKENKLKYANKKQFIDIAVYEKLSKEARK
jgi:K+-sensing histidine kinase KdpD